MGEEHRGDRDDTEPKESATERAERSATTGFRLSAGLRPLSNLLGGLIEMNVQDASPPRGDGVDWPSVDDRKETRRRSEPDSGRKRTKRVRRTTAKSHLIDTRWDDDEFVVTADIPGASVDTLTVGIDPRTTQLVLGRNETVIERVDLPWKAVETTDVWFNNGVLEVRRQPTPDSPNCSSPTLSNGSIAGAI